MAEDVDVDVAVVIVSFNSAHVISALLDSLAAGLGSLRADVVVVDNGSTDESCAVVSARSDCRLVRASNHGYAAGVNRGVASASPARAILVLNPDTVVHPLAVPRMLDGLRFRGTGIVVPRILDAHGAPSWSLRREPTIARALGLTRTGWGVLSEQVTDPDAYEGTTVVDWATGAALLMSRECYVTLGGWDESFFLYSEETDFCLRARDAGLRTRYVPEAAVSHIGGQSGTSPETHSMQVLNRVRLYRRRHGRLASSVYFAVVLTNEATRVPRGGGPASRRAVRDLLRPRHRPARLGLSAGFLPS